MPMPLCPSAATWIFNADFQQVTLKRLAIQSGNGRAGFVAFHFDKSHSTAFPGKDVRIQANGSYCAKLGKQGLEGFFSSGGRQTANKQFLHFDAPLLELKKKTPR